jgi:aconitase B
MTMRTTQRNVTFAHSFRLGVHGEELPAGRYLVEIEEELIQGMSFPAYQRTATMMHLLPNPLRPGVTEVAVVDHEQLQQALAEDEAAANIDPPKVGL